MVTGTVKWFSDRRTSGSSRPISPERISSSTTRGRSATPGSIRFGSARVRAWKLWWRCASCGHEWKTAVATRSGGGSGCPVCGLNRRARTQSEVEPARSLAVKHPEIAAELHPRGIMDLGTMCLVCRHPRR